MQQELLLVAQEANAASAARSFPWPLSVRGFFVPGGGMDAVRPEHNRAEVAGGLGGRAGLLRPEPRARGRARAEVLHARDAPVPLRDAAHGARPQLHAGRRPHAFPAAQRLERDAPDGLRLVRPAGRERRDPRGRAPARDHRAEHRAHPDRDAAPGLGDRLGPRGVRARGRVLPLDAVAVPEVLRGRASPTARRRPSTGARRTRPSSRTST